MRNRLLCCEALHSHKYVPEKLLSSISLQYFPNSSCFYLVLLTHSLASLSYLAEPLTLNSIPLHSDYPTDKWILALVLGHTLPGHLVLDFESNGLQKVNKFTRLHVSPVMVLPIHLGQCLIQLAPEFKVEFVPLDHTLSERNDKLLFLRFIDAVQEEAGVHDNVGRFRIPGLVRLSQKTFDVNFVGAIAHQKCRTFKASLFLILPDGFLAEVGGKDLESLGVKVSTVPSISAPKFHDRGELVHLRRNKNTE